MGEEQQAEFFGGWNAEIYSHRFGSTVRKSAGMEPTRRLAPMGMSRAFHFRHYSSRDHNLETGTRFLIYGLLSRSPFHYERVLMRFNWI